MILDRYTARHNKIKQESIRRLKEISNVNKSGYCTVAIHHKENTSYKLATSEFKLLSDDQLRNGNVQLIRDQ